MLLLLLAMLVAYSCTSFLLPVSLALLIVPHATLQTAAACTVHATSPTSDVIGTLVPPTSYCDGRRHITDLLC